MKTEDLPKFLFLVYFEAKKLRALNVTEKKALDRESFAYDVLLQKNGNYICAEALQSAKTSRVVAVRRGKPTVAAGPVAKTREQLGGFILIKARTIVEAETIAAGIPLAKLGRIEVRPVYSF